MSRASRYRQQQSREGIGGEGGRAYAGRIKLHVVVVM